MNSFGKQQYSFAERWILKKPWIGVDGILAIFFQ
jgi:hypothetical protein